MLKAAIAVFIAHGAGTILSFLRNVIIGRMVSVEDFGIVSTFALAFAIIQTATDVGFDRMIVQDKHGRDEGFQSCLHSLQVLRGLAGMIFFLIFAWPYAWFLGNLDIYWAYLVVSVVPLIRGFIHFDVYRFQRSMKFVPTALITGGAPAASLLLVVILLPLVPDYRVMLAAIIVQQSVFVILTHVLAQRRWRLSWDPVVVRRALRFGLPLLLNGFLVFAIHNGDMLLVGSFLGMEVLGWFYVATLLTITLALHLDTTIRSVVLPGLSRSLEDRAVFDTRAREAVELSAAAGIVILGAIYLLGPVMVLGLFGAKYAQALPYLIPMAALYAIKTMKVGPNVIALAQAKTHLPALTNLPRALSLAIAALAMAAGAGLPTLLAITTSSEMVGVVIAYYFATRPGGGLPLNALLRPFALLTLAMGLVILDTLMHPPQLAILDNFRWTQIPICLVVLASLTTLPALNGWLRKLLGAGT